MCRYETTMFLYIPHMDLLHWTIQSEALLYIHFTLLAYVSEQKCLPDCTYMSNCTSTTIAHIQMPHYCTHLSKISKQQCLLTILLQNMCQQQICPLRPHICYTSNYLICINGKGMPIYMPHIHSLASTL